PRAPPPGHPGPPGAFTSPGPSRLGRTPATPHTCSTRRCRGISATSTREACFPSCRLPPHPSERRNSPRSILVWSPDAMTWPLLEVIDSSLDQPWYLSVIGTNDVVDPGDAAIQAL